MPRTSAVIRAVALRLLRGAPGSLRGALGANALHCGVLVAACSSSPAGTPSHDASAPSTGVSGTGVAPGASTTGLVSTNPSNAPASASSLTPVTASTRTDAATDADGSAALPSSGSAHPTDAAPDASGLHSTDAGSGDGGVLTCPLPPSTPRSERTVHEVTVDQGLEDALANASAGDTLVLGAGNYPATLLVDLDMQDYVTIAAAPGADVTFDGLTFENSHHFVLRGIRVNGTLELSGSSHFHLVDVELDAGTSPDAALQIQGQGAHGATHDVTVLQSRLRGGGRTVFILGAFAPREQWNHHLTFADLDVSCGSNVCFQISGGRDLRIEDSRLTGDGQTAILTAGTYQTVIARNRLTGSSGSALGIATPGHEWDNYAGVENMISSHVTIENNLISGFDTAISLLGSTAVSIVYNTVVDGAGVWFEHRIPTDQQGAVILTGNTEVRLWNNILPSLSFAAEEARPVFESNNLVWGQGGGGVNLITDPPNLDAAADYAPGAGSPALDAALTTDDTPRHDLTGSLRGAKPDIGAREVTPQRLCTP